MPKVVEEQEKLKSTVGLRLKDAELEALRRYASQKQMTVNEYMRVILRRELANPEILS